MLKPSPLVPGSPVRVVAPASPFDRNKFERGARAIEEMGLTLEIPDDVYARTDYLAGEDPHRGDALVAALEDPNVTAIWCARGGFGATRLLPRLAAARPSGPKLLIGFSDISALIALWFARFGMTAIHGPVITSLADEPEESRAHLWRLLSGAGRGLSCELHAGYHGPAIEGTLYASNLSLLAHLVGTPFLPDLSGCIVALEDVGERPYRLDRLLTHLKQSNIFVGAAALLLGTFHDCDERDGSILAEQGLSRGLQGVTVPVLRGLRVGHSAPNFALPVGVRARVYGAELSILEEPTDTDAPAHGPR